MSDLKSLVSDFTDERTERASHGRTSGWSASFDVELPAESWFSLHPATYDRIGELLAGEGPIFRVGPGVLGVTCEFDADSVASAQAAASRFVQDVVSLLGLPASAVFAVRVESTSATAPAPLGDVPDCVGVGEAADILRVTKQRISQLRRQPGFPRPLFQLKATPVWRRSDIEIYGRSRKEA